MSDADVALSIGYGRLHLMMAAEWLARAGCRVRLICGWVPRNPDGWLVRLCSWLIGRDLSSGMRKRVLGVPGVEPRPLAFADFIDQGMRFVNRKFFHGRYHARVSTWGWRLFGWLSRRHLKRGINVFHVRSGAGQGGAIAKARRLGMKVIVDHSIAHPAFMDRELRGEYERNGTHFDLGMDSPFWRLVVKDCEEADVVMVNSFFVRDTFIEQGFPEEKIKVVYLGVRDDFWGLRRHAAPKDGRPLRLLFTGGFGFRKGGEYILEALKLLKMRGVRFHMDCVGEYSGSMPLIKRYAKDLDIVFGTPRGDDHDVIFYGQKPQDELRSFLANGDIYLFPSLAEGCAQSGMEALAAGLCVVATRESGLPLTNDINGAVVKSRDAVMIADKLEWLSRNRDEIDRLGSAAAKLIADNFTWQRYSENCLRLYGDRSVCS